MPTAKPAQIRPRCIFCRDPGKPITEEHFFAKWMTDMLGENDRANFTAYTLGAYNSDLETGEKEGIELAHQKWSGPARSQKFRIACRDCNSGWMSAIEGAAKPILSRLYEGAAGHLSAEEQAAFAAWAVLKAIEGQHSTSTPPRVSEAQVALMYESNAALTDGWWVWVGRQDSERRLTYAGCNAIASRPDGTEFTAFTLSLYFGQTYICVFHSLDLPVPETLRELLGWKMTQVWPVVSGAANLMFRPALATVEALRIANALGAAYSDYDPETPPPIEQWVDEKRAAWERRGNAGAENG